MVVFFLSLCSFYLIAWVSSGIGYFRQSKKSLLVSRISIYLCLITHLVYLLTNIYIIGLNPFENLSLFFVSLSFLSSALLVLYYRLKQKNSLIFIITFLSLNLLLFSYFAEHLPDFENTLFVQYPGLRNILLFFHASSLTIGYISFALGALFSCIFLYLEKSLKNKTLKLSANPAPSLGMLERFIVTSSWIGFVLMTLGLIFGLLMGYFTHVGSSITLRQGIPFITWWIYAAYLLLHLFNSLRGKNIAIWSLVGFVSVVSSFSFEIWSLFSN